MTGWLHSQEADYYAESMKKQSLMASYWIKVHIDGRRERRRRILLTF